jgi:hypothetical protein
VEIDDAIRYLAGRIGIRKIAEMKFNNEKIQKVRKIITMLAGSSRKVNQAINTYKTFVLPRLD